MGEKNNRITYHMEKKAQCFAVFILPLADMG